MTHIMFKIIYDLLSVFYHGLPPPYPPSLYEGYIHPQVFMIIDPLYFKIPIEIIQACNYFIYFLRGGVGDSGVTDMPNRCHLWPLHSDIGHTWVIGAYIEPDLLYIYPNIQLEQQGNM